MPPDNEAAWAARVPKLHAVAKAIGEVLRQARLDAGLSTRDVERMTGMSTAALSQIENGVRKEPAFNTVLRVARAIGISLEEIAYRIDGKNGTSSASPAAQSAKAVRLISKAKADAANTVQQLDSALAVLRVPRKTSRKK